MKRLLILSILFLTVCLVDTSFAQRTENRLTVVKLDKDLQNYADPFEAVVIPGDTLQFETVDGDFSIYIENAISILYTEDVNLKIELTQDNPKSEKYVVRKVENDVVKKTYSVFCITTKSWPKDAPPRIIISAETTQQ
jgi:hypothetical protein